MRRDVANLWISELRSGFWEQGKYFLEHTQTYSVYGILANIAATQGVCSHTGKGICKFDGAMFVVPPSVIEWAELKSHTGLIPGWKYDLSEIEDNGKSFKGLADIIEKHWADL